MHNEKLLEKLKELPHLPGCYIWKNADGEILYIGKAVSLKNRVNSYINNYNRLDPKIRMMVDQVDDVEWHTVDSEVEALILETNLIKKYRPKYNKLMKDDKNYSYVMIDWYHDYPSVKIVREQDDKKAEYYGPYPSRFPIFKVLRRLRKVYPYCEHLPNQLKNSKFQTTNYKIQTTDLKPCFDYHIGLCSGVCAGIVTKEEHRKNITGIRRFFQGKKLDLIDDLKKDMADYSKKMDFEKAAHLRDRISDLEYVTQRIRIDKDMDEEKLEQMKDELSRRALTELVEKLGFEDLDPNKPDFKIECFDISNIQGTNAVGSMVVSVNGKPAKNLYRKFKIRTKQTPDDFEMMRETLTRRFQRFLNSKTQISSSKQNEQGNQTTKNKHEQNTKDKSQITKIDESFSVLPDILIVDGGKGQLSAAYGVLKQLGLDHICLIGLAKREEEIFYVSAEGARSDYAKGQAGKQVQNKLDLEFGRVKLPRRSEALYLIQRIRDEAHRFGITFHRKLRGKASTKSILDDVKGVGKVVRKKLLDAFGSVDGIKKATEEELLTVVRNKSTVKNIRDRI